MKSKVLLLTALAGTAVIGTAALAIRPNGGSTPPKANPHTSNNGAISTRQTDADTAAPPSAPDEVHPAKTAEEVAERLDDLLQPRFLLRGQEFGLSRIYIPLNSHQFTRYENGKTVRTPLYALVGANPLEFDLIKAADAANRPYVIGFVRGMRTLGKPTDKAIQVATPNPLPLAARFETLAIHSAIPNSTPEQDRKNLTDWQKDNFQTVNAALKEPVEKARKGEKVETQAGDWLVVLRPVKANESCLECHGRAKAGDTLGVMAYAVHNPITNKTANR